MLRVISCSILLAAVSFVLGHALLGMARSMTFRTFVAMSGLLCATVVAVAFSLDWIATNRPSQRSRR